MLLDSTKGSEVYNKFFLRIYDFYVLSFAGRLIWKCPKSFILALYNRYVSNHHLEIGVGTGYFLDKCRFPCDRPNITLMDLNSNCLSVASNRIKRYQPAIYQGNICQPISLMPHRLFDSVGMNYLLHCLSGNMETKIQLFANIKPYLNPGAVIFGATVLGKDIKTNFITKRYLKFCNDKHIFTNTMDDLKNLENGLKKHFKTVSVEQVGCAAVFIAKNE